MSDYLAGYHVYNDMKFDLFCIEVQKEDVAIKQEYSDKVKLGIMMKNMTNELILAY